MREKGSLWLLHDVHSLERGHGRNLSGEQHGQRVTEDMASRDGGTAEAAAALIWRKGEAWPQAEVGEVGPLSHRGSRLQGNPCLWLLSSRLFIRIPGS